MGGPPPAVLLTAVPDVYRAPMHSRRDEVNVAATIARARALGLCGFGGVLEPAPADLAAALALARRQDVRLARRIARFAEVEAGSYAWTRDPAGLFWLGRIGGSWCYDADGAVVDLVHVRPCQWLATPLLEREVPAAAVATFRRGGRNFQQTHDPSVGAETQRVWDARD